MTDSPAPLRLLVIGGAGMLGQEVVRAARNLGWSVESPVRSDLDLLDPQQLRSWEHDECKAFDWCVNCAAYTQVDKAEEEFTEAMRQNGVGPGLLADLCRRRAWRLAHISTDFVFDGEAELPYPPTALPRPLGRYGASKLFGEQKVREECPDSVIVRTAWLFGPGGGSFPRTMIRAWLSGRELRVVGDQTGSPTPAADLAASLLSMLGAGPAPGVYHLAGPEPMTWHELAGRSIRAYREAHELDAPQPEIAAIATADWPTLARRPRYSVLDSSEAHSAGASPFPPLDDSLRRFALALGGPGSLA
jgi:dTDP-4-dehydrorhamnose reductase